LRRAEGGAKIVGVFRVKNHDFTPTNHIFSNFGSAPVLDFTDGNLTLHGRPLFFWFLVGVWDVDFTLFNLPLHIQ
jgi:hypothetical protein